MLSEVRSGLDIIIMFNGVRKVEIKTSGKELNDYWGFTSLIISYQGLMLSMVMQLWIKEFDWTSSSSVKHRLSIMDYHGIQANKV